MSSRLLMLFSCAAFTAGFVSAADQTVPGAGNGLAETIASNSQFVQSAKQTLLSNAQGIQDATLRNLTLDAISNPATCITHRAGLTAATKNAIVQNLVNAGLINPADASGIQGGMVAGVFPPVLNDGSACPQLPLSFNASPGSSFGGHHSYPGGLPVHEANNDQSDINFADLYRGSYGSIGSHGLPVVKGEKKDAAVFINQDIILAAPMWHDWAKPIVFQWNADGTEFTELNFGGAGTNDAWGAPGDSRTGGHHIISIAESMKRGLSPEMVITQASAHSAPTSGNEYKVVNWLSAAAMLAQIDPVAAGYLIVDSQNNLRLPPLRQLGAGVNLNANGQTNLLVEYALHNLSDSDFNLSGPAVSDAQVLLADVASQFGYDPSNTTTYNTKYRNVALSNLGAERLLMIYGNSGIQGVVTELKLLRQLGLI